MAVEKKLRRKQGRTHKSTKYHFILGSMVALFFCMLFPKWTYQISSTGDNYFEVFLNGTSLGFTDSAEEMEHMLIEVRREVASEHEGLCYMEPELEIRGQEVLLGNIDSDKAIRARMKEVLYSIESDSSLTKAYLVKINQFMVYLSSLEEVETVLQAAVDQYVADSGFKVGLVMDDSRKFNSFTSQIEETVTQEKTTKKKATGEELLPEGGISLVLSTLGTSEVPSEEMSLQDYDLGVESVSFVNAVEIAPGYQKASALTSLEVAIEEITKEQEQAAEYEIQSGDTLMEISMNLGIPMDTIVSMNSELLDNENSIIHVGDKLLITSPEPELSVEHTERIYVEETYEAEIQYVANDNWYTNQMVTLQQPSAGFRKAVIDVTYVNGKETARTVVQEDVLMDAVPKIVERGTKIPPTYLKPLSGGKKTAGWGPRPPSSSGASTYHKGIDWATPTGTPIYASSGGTVVKAGWGTGYGWVIYIDHPGGFQTRYAHLSKMLVSVGQTVKQGEKIALSGATGIHRSPHLHFEILINGKQVNADKYLTY